MDLSSFNRYIREMPKTGIVDYLRNIYPQNIKVVYENNGSRAMLCTYNRNSPFKYAGIIVADNKVISVPNRPPVTQYSPKVLDAEFKNASVYPANDGTTITMYYWDNKWRMSSHRGYDIGHYTRFSLKGLDESKSYKECLDEVFAMYNFKYECLYKTKCYTLGFRHPELQPFDNKNMSAWFIQSVDLKKFNNGEPDYVSDDEKIGIPMQVAIDIDLDSALKKSQDAYDQFCENGIMNYGYLIKIDSRLYLIESSLLNKIRKIFYSIKFNKYSKNNRIYHIILYFFLDSKYYTIFQKLFPQYIPLFTKIENNLNILMDKIVNRNSDNAIVETLYNEISSILTIKKYSKNTTRYLISKYIYSPPRAPLLYEYLNTVGLWNESL